MTRTKRSRAATAVLLGTTAAMAMTLSGCEEERDLTFFETSEQCLRAASASSQLTEDDCNTAFEAAMSEHAVAAPRYEDLALCEEQHGEGACAVPEEAGGRTDPASQDQGSGQAHGGGTSFMPFMMGYMMGNMGAGSDRAAYSARPLYRDAKSGSWFTSSGTRSAFSGTPGATTKGYASSVRAQTGGKIQAPMTRADVTKAGGFARSVAGRGG